MSEKHGRKSGLAKEGKQYLKERNARMDKYVEKWSRNEIGAGLIKIYEKNREQARNVALLVENQERYLQTLSETIISQQFQTRPENILKIVRIGSANSNRANFCTEFPLETVDDALYYIDMIYEKTLRGATADQKIYENINRYYAGEMEETASTDTGATHTFTITNAPIVTGKVYVMLSRELIGVDDGAGSFTAIGGTKLDTTSSAVSSYTTGSISIVLTDGTGVVAGDVVVITQFDSEKSTLYDQFGKVSLTVSKKRFSARPMPLGWTYTLMTELMLDSEGLGSVDDMLIKAVGDEHAKARDYKAIGKLRGIALTNTTETFDTAFADAGEVSDKMHAQKILPKIETIGANIYNDLKRGKVNKAIAGSYALAYLKKHDLWKTDNTQERTGVYYAGTLDDIEVYVCPADSQLVANNEVILTYKNPLEGMDVGLAYGVLTELRAELRYPEFYVDGNIATVEDSLVLNTKFVRLLQLNNLTF